MGLIAFLSLLILHEWKKKPRIVAQDVESLGCDMKMASVGTRGREVSEVRLAWSGQETSSVNCHEKQHAGCQLSQLPPKKK